MSDYVKPTIYKTRNGDIYSYTMDGVKVGDRMMISFELLESADRTLLQQDGDIITMLGQSFRVFERDHASRFVRVERI